MDWYFDLVMLAVTFFVISLALTIYVRTHPTRARYPKYVYIGIIPTITISSPDDSSPPPTLSAADDKKSEELQEREPCSAVVENPQDSEYLQVPVLDDDYDEEEENEQQKEHSDSASSPASTTQVDYCSSSQVEVEEIEDTSVSDQELEQPLITEEEEEIRDQSSPDCFSEKESQSDTDDLPLETYEILPATKRCPVNGSAFAKYGMSHTVEHPLFPFSEPAEEEVPSVRNRFKKRLSE